MSTGLCWLWLALTVIALDRASKQWIVQNFWLGKSVPVLPFLNFTYTQNPGAAFSFLADKGGWSRFAFSGIAIIITMILLIIMYHLDTRDRLSKAAYAMMIGGALGNVYDRIVHGVVIDFIDVYLGHWHWPTFNLADIGIFIGAVLIVREDCFCTTARQLLNRKMK